MMKKEWVRRLFRRRFLPLGALGCVLFSLTAMQSVKRISEAFHATTEPVDVILIDPGHGGADGGTSGTVDGQTIQEKDVNLSIGQSLSSLLRVLGFEVRMTREDDRSIHDTGATTLREQKISDMHNRLEMYNQASLVVSIHQNQFPQSQYHGTQVFYAPLNSESKRLGETIRANVLALLQPDNTRELKKGEKSLYLLSHTTVPTALVECGFLSNPEECAKLNDADYRRQMTFAIAGGLLQYMSKE